MPAKKPPADPARLDVAHMTPDSNVRYEHPLLTSYRRSLRRSGLAQSTLDHYIGSSLDYLAFAETSGFPDVAQVRREHIETWEVWMREDRKYSAHTIRNRFVGLRMWIRWLVEEGEISRDPTARMPLPKIEEVDKDVLSIAEVEATIKRMEIAAKARDSHISEVRDLAVVSLLYAVGARATETARALRTDADLDAGTLVLRAVNTKAGQARTVGLGEVMVTRLDRYFRRRKDTHPALFVGRRGALTRSGVYDIVRDAFAETGKVISPHDLRHTSASHVAGDLSETQLMDSYGWRDPKMARLYTRTVRQGLAAEAQRKASPLEKLGR